MAKLLYITANPKTENESFSLSVGRAFLNAYKQQNPQDEVVELDLYQTDIPHIDQDVFSGWGKLQQGHAFDQLSAEEKQKVSRINQLTDQFIEADKYVFVTPMWNFSFPPKMKAYIDTICMAGKTFKYTENGPVGLLTDKKAVHIQARGGIYSEGPMKDMEFGDRYLKTVLSFIGITNVQSIIVEGMAQFPNEAESIKEKAIKQAEEVAKNF
ncbi:FMN-dependent NADH-azoreductase [Thermaerobacillus caldiproteolyticus]|uniref:FMN dependent NADH:quinone oxidoreductase n=1 Tax=Thermaerobacillus caldiproteolyticus TaxID=247480 RepID=A0A7V9Z772_9BACL|nr:FMN-dependent NADH-azoreductase [Anoxybacillus caldiproteolyticus]MBA2875298.1 FMN-dependent NADH-azoreductase [Anoxybacillus caldiproteolyticus]QPA32611.1 FMN-dependent NADH-azoreductase [Anoxybacillus caldiproteolyticus]